jgi:hypothetical protein
MINKGYFGSLPRHAFAVRLLINKPVETRKNLPKLAELQHPFLPAVVLN